jgi:hypothetical protein
MTPEEWREWQDRDTRPIDRGLLLRNVGSPQKLMAMANDALSDNHPRKITPNQIAVLKLLRAKGNESNVASSLNLLTLDSLIDTLVSILPPEIKTAG